MCYLCFSTPVVEERRRICVISEEKVFSLTDFVRCMSSGKLFHSVVVDVKNDCLEVSVLCFGTCRWSGRRRWYGLVDETSGGKCSFK